MSRDFNPLMLTKAKGRILFCGYAPIHFICFRPIYKLLRRIPGIEVFFSEGERTKQENVEQTYDMNSVYRSYRIPDDRILSVREMRRQQFDLVFCSFVSGSFPLSDRARIHLFHGVSFRNMAVRRDVLIYDYLFVIGPYQIRLFAENQLVRKGDPRLIPIGFPKLDTLLNDSLDKSSILRKLGFSGRRPILTYAPTGQKGNSLETIGEEVIRRLKKLKKYDLIIKPHDHPRDQSINWPRRLLQFEDEHTKVLRDFDIVPYLFVTDLLITDASSVSSEFSLLDRPMVFVDVPEMIKALQMKGVPVDLDSWGRKAGVTARWPDEVIDAVQWSLNHSKYHSSIRRAMAEDMFFNPGHATEKAVEWILNWFDQRSSKSHART